MGISPGGVGPDLRGSWVCAGSIRAKEEGEDGHRKPEGRAGPRVTWGQGHSSVDVKALCLEEKSMLLSVLQKPAVDWEARLFLRPPRQTHHSSPGAGVECHCKESAVCAQTLGLEPSCQPCPHCCPQHCLGLFELIKLWCLGNSRAMLSPVYNLQMFSFLLEFLTNRVTSQQWFLRPPL